MVDTPAGQAPINIRDSTVTVVGAATATANSSGSPSPAADPSGHDRWLFVREIRSWEARLVGYGVVLLGIGNLIMAILNHLDS